MIAAFRACVFLVCMSVVVARLHAAPIPLVNHSFEDPILADGAFQHPVPGWIRTNTFCGVFNPNAAAIPAGAPDGQNVAFLDGVSMLTQQTGAILQPNTRYTLTLEYGSQASFAGIAPYAALRAGGNFFFCRIVRHDARARRRLSDALNFD